MANMIVLAGFLLLMFLEYVISKLFNLQYGILSISTIIFYVIFLCVQVLHKIYRDVKKDKISLIMKDIIIANNGIPIVNKDGKIIIKWDIIFKKLIEKKELKLYEKILEVKPSVIDYYVNIYPALLLNHNTDMIENKHKVDLNSIVKNDLVNDKNDLVNATDEKPHKEIFIKEISNDKAVFCNYDKSIYVSVLLINEDVNNGDDLSRDSQGTIYDGFSVQVYFNNEKYILVPKIVVKNKKIDKGMWFYRNINTLKRYIEELIQNNKIENQFKLSESDLNDYTEIININKSEYEDFIVLFNNMQVNKLSFTMLNLHNLSEKAIITCELQISHNNFELIFKNITRMVNNEIQNTDEIQKTVVLGNSYNPISTILENMPMIIMNIRLIINNKELDNIIIKD